MKSNTLTHLPVISYQALHKATRITKYVYQYYFPLHGLTEKDISTYAPVLTFVESIIYQADLILENQHATRISKNLKSEYTQEIISLKTCLIDFLKEMNLYDDLVESKLYAGEEYIKIETQLNSQKNFQHIDIIKAAELRSSDIRLLHLILFRLLGKSYDEKLLSLVWPVEVIADIESDFVDYKDDVSSKNHNTYRMLVSLYQEKAPDVVRNELATYEAIFYERLSLFPKKRSQRLLRLYLQFRQRNCAEAPVPILE